MSIKMLSSGLLTRSLSGRLLSFAMVVLLLTAPGSCNADEPDDAVMFSRNKILTLVNKARLSGRYCGRKWYAPTTKLKWNDRLEAAARIHSKDMYQHNTLSHKGSDGKFVDDRLYSQHYLWTACGENVAYGALYEDEVMQEWLKSPGHCENIMNPEYTEMGAWLTGMYWTQVLAKPQDKK
jgi:uncharacterized protein YkwD